MSVECDQITIKESAQNERVAQGVNESLPCLAARSRALCAANPVVDGPEILAHRGQWIVPHERNSLHSLRLAIEAGFGVETDVRDCGSKLVVSHDPPGSNAPLLKDFLDIYAENRATAKLALNIKADGLVPELAKLIGEYGVVNHFAFDMSIPEMLSFQRSGMPFYSRLSELEPTPILYDSAAGIWLDSFQYLWWKTHTITDIVSSGKCVAVVSPELHRRAPEEVWQQLSTLTPAQRSRLLLCTDLPAQASRFFHGN